MDELLKALLDNALESPENLAKMLDMPVDQVRQKISDYEKDGIIRGYQAIVDEEKLDAERVHAIIEVKVTPQREGGFDQIALRISRFDEVESVFLISGSLCDLVLIMKGDHLKQVSSFVSEKLAPIDGITSTSTHFIMKTYKQNGVIMETQDEYERLKISP